MAKFLVIVESPAKARTINRYLGKGYSVKASMGHLIDLPKNVLGVSLDDNFKPHYVVIRGKEKILKMLKEEAKKAEKVFLASDPDREGEAIAYHISQRLGKDKKAFQRVTLFEITKDSVKNAFLNPGKMDLKKVAAQQARRILDRLVGYKVSPILWKAITYSKGLSAGRVQTVALRLICEREEAIKKFVPQEYWSIVAKLKGSLGDPFEAKLVKIDGKKVEIGDEKRAQEIKAQLLDAEFVVFRIEKKEKKRNPPPPFITSTLQQEAAKTLGFSANKTMKLAQELYEGLEIGEEGAVGLITYMRTDSTRTAPEALKLVRNFIEGEWGKDYLPSEPRIYKEKATIQGAHEAIRPTNVFLRPADLEKYVTKDQLRLYQLIWNRFVGSQMNPALYDATIIEISAKDRYLFRSTGSILKFPGFSILYPKLKDEILLPPLKLEERLILLEIIPSQHFTEPPSRYSEATLIAELEKKGIGRPSTYAPIVSIIQEREYVRIESGKFLPTELGTTVNRLLISRFPNIFDVGFTAEMETELDKIEEGKLNWIQVLQNFYDPFQETLEKAELETKELRKELQKVTDLLCEICGKPLV